MRKLYILLTVLIAFAAQAAMAGATNDNYSAAALFNRGNVYARQGRTGVAILNYERAQLLAPHDADIAANLHFVRARAGLPDVSESRLKRDLTFISPNAMAWLGSIGLALAGISLLFKRRAFRALTMAGALLVGTAMGSALTMWPRLNGAVVTVPAAIVRTSPVPAAEPLFKLREGETVTVRAQHKDFALIETSTAHSGWINRSDISPLTAL